MRSMEEFYLLNTRIWKICGEMGSKDYITTAISLCSTCKYSHGVCCSRYHPTIKVNRCLAKNISFENHGVEHCDRYYQVDTFPFSNLQKELTRLGVIL